MATDVSGIPDIRVRVDNSEEAREWNKMRGAVISLFNKAFKGRGAVIGPQRFGFRPIALRYHQDADSLEEFPSGVGISPGQLRFLRTQTITEEAGADNNAVEIYPTVNSRAIDLTDPTPRESLGDGDWEAWVVFKEIGTTNEARISFQTLDAGPGTVDRDEKAVRLCSFSVVNHEETELPPRIFVYEQNVKNSLAVWTDVHQFKVTKTEDDKVKVEKGFLVWLKGLSDPLVSESVEAEESGEITITGNGSIWLHSYYSLYQQSQSTASSGITLRMYRNDSLSTPTFSFRATEPTRGTNSTDRFTSGSLWFEIAKVELVGGEAFVTDQIINGPIYVNEIVDGYIADS